MDDILQQDDPRVHEIALECDFEDVALSFEIKTLKNVLDSSKLSGIAATQIGLMKRIVIVRNKRLLDNEDAVNEADFEEIILINPEILSRSEGTEDFYEGCGSVEHGEVFGLVNRPKKIVVEAQYPNGEQFKIKAKGFLARVIQHECDHLDGIIFTDKLVPGTTLLPKTEYLALREKERLDKKSSLS